MYTVTVVPNMTEEQARVKAIVWQNAFRATLKTQFTGNLRLASDGYAYMAEYSQRRGGKSVITWYRIY